jgi:hypothetical protein
MKARVVLTMDFDIGEGDPDEPNQPFEKRVEEGWYDELQAKMESPLFNYSYAKLLSHSWRVINPGTPQGMCTCDIPGHAEHCHSRRPDPFASNPFNAQVYLIEGDKPDSEKP